MEKWGNIADENEDKATGGKRAEVLKTMGRVCIQRILS